MLRRQRRAVHLVCEHGVPRVVEPETALVLLLDLLLETAVEPGEDDLRSVVERRGLLQQRRQRYASPSRSSDGLVQPRLAARARIQSGSAVPSAFHRDGKRDPGPSPDLLEGKGSRGGNMPGELERPRCCVDERDVEVHQEVVHPDGRDVIAEPFERHAVVPSRGLQLLHGDVIGDELSHEVHPLWY